MKRKVHPSPPSFKGRRWGKSPHLWFSLLLLHQCNRHMDQSKQNIIVKVMVLLIYFYFHVEGCCAAKFLRKQRSVLGKDLWNQINRSVSEKAKCNAPLRSTLQHDNRNKPIIPLPSPLNSTLIDPLYFCVGVKNEENSASLTSFL